MGRFIVMDIVFYAGSLNYDQGSGNYQELKKITKWDGKQYTFVSRYALRYSLLETGKQFGLWQIAEGESLSTEGKGDQKVIQPAEKLLFTGEILKYPEFDLFGYLITSTTPQNFREAPVKISHAVSMTPFNYDALFNANLGLANRLRKIKGDMKPNPFTSEEHMTYYLYSVVVDLERIGQIESYYQIKGEDKRGLSIEVKDNALTLFTIDKNKKKKELLPPIAISDKSYNLSELILPIASAAVPEELKNIVKFNPESDVVIWKYELTENKKRRRVKNLIQAILKLRRYIKGRDEDLSPKLLVLGLYKDVPYRTYRDKIILKDEYTEEEHDEIITEQKDGKIVRKVIHKVSRSKKPIFEIYGKKIDEEGLGNVWDHISKFFGFSERNKQKEEEGQEKVYIFHDPSIEVRVVEQTKGKNKEGE